MRTRKTKCKSKFKNNYNLHYILGNVQEEENQRNIMNLWKNLRRKEIMTSLNN